MESLKIYVQESKTSAKWILTTEFTDEHSAYIHKSLEDTILGKYLLGYRDVKSIRQKNNHDGTRTIIAYTNNDVKLVYTIKA